MNRHARTLTRSVLAASIAAGISLTATPAQASTNSAPGWFIVAHRGGDHATPESTLAAFQHMIDIKVDGVEFDIHMTKDKVPIVLHDETLNRTTNCTGAPSKKTYAQLQKCDAGSWFSSQFRGQRVPSVNTALAFIKARTNSNFVVFLHVKVTGSSNAKKIMSVVKKQGMGSRVVTIADSPTTLKSLKSAGATRQGLVFNSPAGYSSGYKYLIPYNVTTNSAVIKAAHKKGQQVLPVESHPHSLAALDQVDVDGVLANNLLEALIRSGRLAAPSTARSGAKAKPAHEPGVPAAGPSRTTGPMDF
jgi:glycerophosphoryl diester phosphodiesterase